MKTSDSPRLAHSTDWFALILAVIGLVGCVEGPIMPASTDPAGGGPGHVATPPPRAIATPTPPEAMPVATPTPGAPATPTPAPSATPTPAGADGAASDAAEPDEGYEKTGRALDLAVSGEAYFVLSTKSAPESVADLLFTRDGALTLEEEEDGALSVYRLRHQAHRFHVVGYSREGAGAPLEAEGGGLALMWDGEPQPAMGLALDADRNAEAPRKLAFDYTGRLRVEEADPRSPAGDALTAYVALARFEAPEGLTPLSGFAGVYRYAEAAGAMRLGVAVSGEGRPLGSANLILTGTLEQGD